MSDTRTWKPVDRVLYVSFGLYLLLNLLFILWFVSEGATAILVMPQFVFKRLRFSALANVVATAIILAMALSIYLLAGYASAV